MEHETFGARLKRIRETLRIKQCRVAKVVKKSAPWLSQIEADEIEPSERDILLLADALGIYEHVLRGTPAPEPIIKKRRRLEHL